MIAPNRDPDPQDPRSSSPMIITYHATASATGQATASRPVHMVSKPQAWAFVAWTLGLAASYFALRTWWTLRE